MKKLICAVLLALFGKGINKAIATTGGMIIYSAVKSQTNNLVTRPIDASTFVVSSTKDAYVYYTIKINCTATIGSPASGSALLQITTDFGANWIDVSKNENSVSATLATLLSINNNQTTILTGVIPANLVARIVPTTSGSCALTYIVGQETLK